MDNPAGLASFKTLNKLCVEAAADFLAGVGSLALLSPAWLHSHIHPWLTACHTPSLAKASQTTVAAKLSGPKTGTNKSALLPTFLSLLGKHVRLLLALFFFSTQSSGRLRAFFFSHLLFTF